MKMDGLQRLLDFLEVLREKNIWFRLEQTVPDGVMVMFTLIGARVEATFMVDEMQYSIFRGNEDVEVDEKALMNLLKERGE